MSNTYRLVDDGYGTFKKIKTGTRQIGIVRKVSGGFLGIIGQATYVGKSENEAYCEVVARHCGYANYATMRDRNQIVLQERREARQAARYVSEELIKGNFKPFEELITKAMNKP